MQLNNDQIMLKCLAGSRLYGTSNEASDFDYKYIFAHTLQGLIVGEDETERTEDPSTNSEAEYFSLKKFAQLLSQNQTVALELLFIPSDKVLISTPAWEEIVSMRDRIVSRDLMPFIGYARNQARIYSAKGDRLEFLHLLKKHIENYVTASKTNPTMVGFYDHLYEAEYDFMLLYEERDYISSELKFNQNLKGMPVKQVNILGKGFEEFSTKKTWVDRIDIQINKYGERAQLARDNTGHDVKATYHAVRVISEAIELLETGKLIFPRPEVDLLLEIRAGKFSYESTCSMVQERVDILENLMKQSTLRDSPDKQAITNWYQRWQRNYIYDELGVNHV